MTNEQLAVLLRKYSEWLEMAIGKLDRELPPDLPRHELANLLGQTKQGHFVCLDDLELLRIQMMDDVNILMGGSDVTISAADKYKATEAMYTDKPVWIE